MTSLSTNILRTVFVLFAIVLFFSTTFPPVLAREIECTGVNEVFSVVANVCVPKFTPLVGIPLVDTTNADTTLADYINALYLASISIAAFLAVLKIIFAGVKYMLSDVVTTKADAKKDIRGALIGLLIVVGAVLILNTVNPQLTGLNALDNIVGVDMRLGRTDFSGDPNNLTNSDGLVIGTRRSIKENNPNKDEIAKQSAIDCGNDSLVIRKFDGFIAFDCYYDDNTTQQPAVVVTIDFIDGQLKTLPQYDPFSSEIALDCQTTENTSCIDFCDINDASSPYRDDPAYCIIAIPERVAAIHCQINPQSESCNYSPYGDPSKVFGDDPESIDPVEGYEADSESMNRCINDLSPNLEGSACVWRTINGILTGILIDKDGRPVTP